MTKLTAKPLANYSSVHEVSFAELFGKKIGFTVTFDFNVLTPPASHKNSSFLFRARDSNSAFEPNTDFSFVNLIRWRLDLTNFKTFEDYLKNLKGSQLRNYKKTVKRFEKQELTYKFIDSDWSSFAETAYHLYENVASRHPPQIYDLSFFRQIAKMDEYKLILCFHENQVIAAAVILDEDAYIHGVCCGLDYIHSTKSFAYSFISYGLIRHAIESKKYKYIDAGFSANEAKKSVGFKGVDCCLDFKSRNRFIGWLLRLVGRFISPTITSEGKYKIQKKIQ